MTKREKILVVVTVVATGASVFMFAFVSLANFLKTTPQSAPPLAAKLYGHTVAQLATLEPVTIAQADIPVNTPATSAVPEKTTVTSEMPKTRAVKYWTTKDKQVSLKKTIEDGTTQLDQEELTAVSTVLKELGIEVNLRPLKQ